MPVTRAELQSRIERIEESYEFFLAFAAQGVRDDRESPSSGQLRDALGKMATALDGMAAGLTERIRSERLEPSASWQGFCETLARDADSALAAVRLVGARAAISSQVIDNLNASIHLRALLTDLFLLDDLLRDP